MRLMAPGLRTCLLFLFLVVFTSFIGFSYTSSATLQTLRPRDLKRCPGRVLCNRAESFDTEFLEDKLEEYFADEYNSALRGDREHIWWALAGGEEGRWWWDKETSTNNQKNGYNTFPFEGMKKRQTQVDEREKAEEEETEEEKKDRMAKDNEEYEAREEEERRQRKEEERIRDDTTKWPNDQLGFCCDKEYMCLGIRADRSLVYCWEPNTFHVLTPDKVLLNVRTLDYAYENGTTGNLRNYQVPPRKTVKYKPPKPTPVAHKHYSRMENESTHTYPREIPWSVTLSCLAVIYFFLSA